MATKVRWGILSTARIGVKKVIPAMQKGKYSEVIAIASRDLNRAKETAAALGIRKAYGSYEEILFDPEVDAIYNPLPNHLHVNWSIKAAEAGKHVLCEKPLSLTVAEALTLLSCQKKTGVKIGEAFMVRTHPQWIRAKDLISSGRIGKLRAITGFFSYFNRDPANIRNVPAYGGGALMDIGCYPINISRFIFGEEPIRALGLVTKDRDTNVDVWTSSMLEFPDGHATFTCSTQLVPYQRMHFFGTTGRIEIEIPFNAPNDAPCRVFVDNGGNIFGKDIEIETFATCDQYTIQGDLFSRAIQENTEVPVSVSDGVKNMAVIEAIFRSAQSGQWEKP